MKRLTVALALSALTLATPVPPALARPDPETAVQPGDRELSCEALAAEINTLATAPAKPLKKKKKGLGFLRVLGAVSPLGGMVGGTGGALASSAMSTVGNVAASEARNARQGDYPAARPSLAEQRLQWLSQIRTEKKC